MNERSLTKDIRKQLLRLHEEFGWVARPEVTFRHRRIDVLGISHGGRHVIGYEIKTSLADFQAELKDPDKRRTVSAYCTGFFFVCQAKLIYPQDIPNGSGLIWMLPNGVFTVVAECDGYPGDAAVISVVHDADRYFASGYDIQPSPADVFDEELPRWLLPRYRRPLYFDEDVSLIAESMCSVRLPSDAVNFEEVPF